VRWNAPWSRLAPAPDAAFAAAIALVNALSITSGGEELLHVSDVVLFPLHLGHPDWLPVFDLPPAQTAASKQAIFKCAAEQHALVFAHHFPPFPNLGHVVKQGAG
jgi:hypothetical protein